MAAKPLEIHPDALAELKAAISWYLGRSHTAAIKFADEVDTAIEMMSESPARWPAGGQGTRKLVLRRFPYAIVYREKEDAVQILAIAHGHRRPDYWKDRL